MKGWNICDDGQLLAQFELEKDQNNQKYLPSHLCSFTKTRTQSTLKASTNRVEKTSLKSSRNQQRPKENCDTNSQTTKASPPVYINKGTLQNSNDTAFKLQEKPNPQKIVCPKINLEKFNPQVSQAYCMNPPAIRMSSKYTSSCNVKINYINPVQPVKLNAEPKKNQPLVLIPSRTLRRMNTEPTRFITEETTKPENKNEIKQESDLWRSVDQPHRKSLKSTQNLNQIKCINAESIADSEELRDEISIVISPLTDQFYLNLPGFSPELWDDRFNESGQFKDSY